MSPLSHPGPLGPALFLWAPLSPPLIRCYILLPLPASRWSWDAEGWLLPLTGMLQFGQESSASPCFPSLRAVPRIHADWPTDRPDPALCRDAFVPRRDTRDRFHRLYMVSAWRFRRVCVQCMWTVELERPPVWWVKPAPLKSPEPSIRRMACAGRWCLTCDRCRPRRDGPALARSSARALTHARSSYTHSNSHSYIWHYIRKSHLCAFYSSCCNLCFCACERSRES